MNGKRKVRFNVVDFLIIIAVLAALFSLFFRSTILRLIGNVVYMQDAVISIRIEGITKEQADAVTEGDILYAAGEKLGEISAVTKMPSSRTVLAGGEKREFIRVSDTEHYDLVCTVTVRGAYNDDGFYLFGQQFLGVGKVITVSSDIYKYDVRVVSIS